MAFFKKRFFLFMLLNVGFVSIYGFSSLNGPLKSRYSLDDENAYVHARIIKEKYGEAAT